MFIQTNIQAMNANRNFNIVRGKKTKNVEKLSSGYRINRSADDAAGLAISEKMRRQIRGLTQAANNAQDGVSFVQIADGALNEISDMLHRSEELAVKASNETLTDDDRAYLQSELSQLREEFDRVANTTVFNEIPIFSKNGYPPAEAFVEATKSAGENSAAEIHTINIEWAVVGADGNAVPVGSSQAVGQDTNYADSAFAKFIKSAAESAASKIQSAFPNLMAKASSSTTQIGLKLGGIDGSGNTLATAGFSMRTSGDSTMMSYTMTVDSADYNINNFDSMTDAQKADLAAVISHEMMHIVMDDTVTNGMINGFPKWFVEGAAQTISGDNGWVSYQLSPTSSDSSIKNYMKQLKTMEYGAGYLGVMALGQAASGSDSISQANIKKGLDKIMTDVASGKSFSDAIKDNTDYTGLTDFQNKFMNADEKNLNFVKDFLNMRGTTGGGSLIAPSFATSEAAAFAPSSLSSGSTNYKLNTDNTQYANAFGTAIPFPDKEDGIYGEDGDLYLQVGSEADQHILLKRFDISAGSILNNDTFNISNVDDAQATIDTVKAANERVSRVRSYYGAMQNRLEHTINNLNNVVENTTAAESAIRDTDMSKEMVEFSKHNILEQAGQTVLAQANQSNQGVLSLLG